MVAVLCVRLCDQTTVAEPSKTVQNERLVNIDFPANRSIGKLYRLNMVNPDGPVMLKPAIEAKGRVSIPSLTKLALVLSYEGGRDLSCLDSLKTDAIYSVDAAHLDNFNDQDLRHISSLPAVSLLLIDDTDITNAGMRSIGKMTQLICLSLLQTPISDVGLTELRHLKSLRRLRLDFVRLTDLSLCNLSEMKDLSYLNLSHCGVSDEGLRCLKPLKALQILHLNDNKAVTDKGIQYLVGLTGLLDLDLSGTAVTSGCLKSLKSMKILYKLTLTLPATTKALCARELPHCSVTLNPEAVVPVEVFAPLK